ncbi:MAG: UvrD-helicase domain-containing protein [Arachnia propionica]|uniref:UvrD-helicase domain-containing protein n=1 Tax=Arachnia propionica TaxID=1750 RepID=UPI0026F8D0DB|nr:UvrD-helicase domain-containing protein [Arachnia propionica]
MIFDITADLPDGPLLLEASAGTGKTWTLVGLAARLVAEFDVPLRHLLVLTFSRAATTELRGRLRRRLVSVADDIELVLAGRDVTDPVARHLASQPDPQVAVSRLRHAVADFGSATVATIHSFCQDQLRSLGVLGDWADDEVRAELRPLIRQCATDEYLRRYLEEPEPPFDPRRALGIAEVAAGSHLELVSDDREALSYHRAVREAFTRRRRELGLVSFDDLPGRLRHLVTDSEVADLVCAELARRFPFVLVDEFQDTDPDQWAILRRCFVERDDTSIILIGDPKQSIYGFRSADLGCYLEAARIMPKQTLAVNHRSEAGVVDGVRELFGDLELGVGIRVEPVRVMRRDDQGTLVLPDAPSARVWIRGGAHSEQQITEDLVAHTTALLTHGSIRVGAEQRRLAPTDIAVLTRTRGRALALVGALQEGGVPATFTGGDSVLHSPAARDWLALLAAVAQPTRGKVMTAALGDLLGVSFGDLLSEQDETPASRRIHEFGACFAASGVSGLVGAVLDDLAASLVVHGDGERRLGDLQQVGQLLLSRPARTVAELHSHLERLIQHEELPEQLASDVPAVRVGTMHGAKGLEYPVVLLPQVSVTEVNLRGAIPHVDASGSRVLHVGTRPSHRDPLADLVKSQCREEELRLLYVALTRAGHLAIAWHLQDRRSASGPLTALLSRDRGRDDLAREYPRLPQRFPFDPRLVDTSSVRSSPWREGTPPPASASRPTLRVSRMGRRVDPDWRRTSYSGLTADLHEHAPDEPDLDLLPTELSGPLAEPSPMNGLPAGARFGTLVHEVLEQVDWSRHETRLPSLVTERAPRLGLDPAQCAQLASALSRVVTTPLGGLFDGCLADLPVSSRLPELDFDLPLGTGGATGTVADLARAMAELLPADDPLAAYPGRLLATEQASARLSGLLTGSIDAVLQLPSGGFLVVDYKTNRVPTLPDQELAVGHYTPDAMAEAMMQAHYPLQAVLYCAALHRHLAWRLPGYSPQRHLAGVGYLFVRGMAGPATPVVEGRRCGVFEWRPPAELTVAVSEVLGGDRG